MKINLCKALLIGLSSCILTIGCSSSQPAAQNRSGATIIDLKNDSPLQRQNASVYVGEIFQVRLPAQTGTGFTWIIEGGASESGVVNLVSRSVQTDQKAKPGAAAQEVF